MKPEKHVALAKEIVDKIRVELLGGTFKQDHIAVDMIAAALSQVERDALASKVVFPTDETVKLAAKKDIGLHREDNRPKTCTNNDFYMAVTSSFIRGAKWALSKITLVPKEQVISPDIDKKEISNDMDNCVCDETHIHNCPVHTHLQDEPEVKAQGLKEFDHPCKNTCSGWQQGFEAGQASQVRLPEKKQIPAWPEDDYSYQEGYNAAIDDMRKLNGLGDV